MIRRAIVALCVLISACWPVYAQSLYPLHRLKVVGMQIRDLNNQPVLLRGYNMASASNVASYTTQDMLDIKAAKLNVVRLTPQWYADPGGQCGGLAQAPASGEYPAVGDAYLPPLTLSTTATIATGSTSLAVTGSYANVGPGDFVSGSGIPIGDYITKINSGTGVATLNVAATGSATSESVTFTGGTSANGYFSPLQLAILDAQVYGAAAAFLWSIIGSTNNNCDFYQNSDGSTNTTLQTQFAAMWTFLATRYRYVDFVAGYEPSTEPNPPPVGSGDTQNQYNNALVATMYRTAISAIRAVDPNMVVFIGPAKNYNSRALAQLYQYVTDVPNVVWNIDFYELGTLVGGYVKQMKETPLGPWGGFPGNANEYIDTRGDQATVSCIYNNEGTASGTYVPKMDLGFLVGDATYNAADAGLYDACVTKFAIAHGLAVNVNQVGIRTWTPGAYAYTTALLDAWNARSNLGTVGWQWWVYRLAGSTPSDGSNGGNTGDLCVKCQGGTGWIVKDNSYFCTPLYFPATGATSTCDPFFQLISDKGSS